MILLAALLMAPLVYAGPPPTPHPRTLLSTADMYHISHKVYGEVGSKGGKDFDSFYSKITPYLRFSGLIPNAIAIGVMSKCQVGLGFCGALQLNISSSADDYELTLLQLGGIELGPQEALTVEFYVAACYGDCVDDQAAGWFVGYDATAALGPGLNGFMDVGLDWNNLWHALYSPHTLDDILKSHIMYYGVGFAAGEGIGMSLGAYNYVLAGYQKIRKSTLESIKLF